MRAVLGIYTMLKAIITLSNEAPSVAIMAIARIRVGKEIKASINRWAVRSVTPPKWTLMTPTIMPIVQPTKDAIMPTYREIRAPYISRLNTSRPRWSAPNHIVPTGLSDLAPGLAHLQLRRFCSGHWLMIL